MFSEFQSKEQLCILKRNYTSLIRVPKCKLISIVPFLAYFETNNFLLPPFRKEILSYICQQALPPV